MNLRSFGNDYHAKVMQAMNSQEDFNLNWEKYRSQDYRQREILLESLKKRDDLTPEERSQAFREFTHRMDARYDGMPKSGQLAMQEIRDHRDWCQAYQSAIYAVQNVPRLHYEAYTIGSAGKTVVGRTR